MKGNGKNPIPPVRAEVKVIPGLCTKRNMAHKKSLGLSLAMLLLASSGVARLNSRRRTPDWPAIGAVLKLWRLLGQGHLSIRMLRAPWILTAQRQPA